MAATKVIFKWQHTFSEFQCSECLQGTARFPFVLTKDSPLSVICRSWRTPGCPGMLWGMRIFPWYPFPKALGPPELPVILILFPLWQQPHPSEGLQPPCVYESWHSDVLTLSLLSTFLFPQSLLCFFPLRPSMKFTVCPGPSTLTLWDQPKEGDRDEVDGKPRETQQQEPSLRNRLAWFRDRNVLEGEENPEKGRLRRRISMRP